MQCTKKHSSGSFLNIVQPFKCNGQPYMAQRFVGCSQTNPGNLESYFCGLVLDFCHHPPNKIVAYESVAGEAVVQSVWALRYKPKACRFDSRWRH